MRCGKALRRGRPALVRMSLSQVERPQAQTPSPPAPAENAADWYAPCHKEGRSALGERANEKTVGSRWPWERWYSEPAVFVSNRSRPKAFRLALAMGEVVQRAGRLSSFPLLPA